MSHRPPQEIVDLASARDAARAAGEWSEADRLRVEIEAAGWAVVDRGTRSRLQPAHPPDVEADGAIRYGRSSAVPSRLGEPASVPLTVIAVADDRPDELAGALSALGSSAGPATQVVVVADDPTPAQATLLRAVGGPAPSGLGGLAPEIVWTSARLGRPAALNAGLRRALGSVVVILGSDGESAAGSTERLVDALDDPEVAIASMGGLLTEDLRRFLPARTGDVTLATGTCAVRRTDLLARGPLDERFLTTLGLETWWSLTLRDEGEGARPRRALAVGSTGVRPGPRDPAEEGSRGARRDYYRLLGRFGRRQDLLIVGTGRGASIGSMTASERP